MSRKQGMTRVLLAVFAVGCLCQPVSAQATAHDDPIPMNDLIDVLDPVRADGGDDDLRQISDTEVDALLELYLADGELQTDRPEWEPKPVAFEPRERRSPNAFLRAIASFFEIIGPLVGYLLLFLIALALLYGLFLMFGESLSLRGRQKQAKTSPDISIVPNLRPEQAAAKALLEDADALAAQGRFAEAVHLLLFRSINDIQEKKQGSISRSLTAREIGRLEMLPKSIRDALSPIITIVERSFFGGRAVDHEGWQRARQSYEDFAFGEAWA